MSAAPQGRVAALWRYPVSSMGGERLERMELLASGVLGDRTHGVFHAETGEIARPGRMRQWMALPRASARCAAEGEVEVSVDGQDWHGSGSLGPLSDLYGFPASIRRYAAPGEEGPASRYAHAPIHLLTTSALRTLQAAIPGSVLDERRFRPNILLDTPEDMGGIPEYGWIGREFRIGGAVLRGTIPCVRCAFTTLAQPGLPDDREVLRALMQGFDQNLGLYCEVVLPGPILPGDSVALPEAAVA